MGECKGGRFTSFPVLGARTAWILNARSCGKRKRSQSTSSSLVPPKTGSTRSGWRRERQLTPRGRAAARSSAPGTSYVPPAASSSGGGGAGWVGSSCPKPP